MNVLLAYMCNHVHAWCLWRSDKDIRSSATGITDSCESPCECWELKPGPCKTNKCSLTAEPPLHHHNLPHLPAPSTFIFQRTIFAEQPISILRLEKCVSTILKTGVQSPGFVCLFLNFIYKARTERI